MNRNSMSRKKWYNGAGSLCPGKLKRNAAGDSCCYGILKGNGSWGSIKHVILILALVICLSIPTYMVFAGESLLSGGGGQVSAGDGYTFKLNFEPVKEAVAEQSVSGAYSVSVTISPDPESISISSGVKVQPYGSKLTFSSADLDAVNSVDITVYPGKDILSETTYTVTASVAGVPMDSESITFTAVPSQQQEEKKEAGEDQTQTQDMQNQQLSGKAASGKSMSSGGSASVDSSLVYAGSWDNYLKSLSVDGYEFTNEFNKTRDTYFVDVPDNVESLDVSAKASDSSATVRIAGADDVSEDMSKIMINVTADNGEVRTYRIYVRHK